MGEWEEGWEKLHEFKIGHLWEKSKEKPAEKQSRGVISVGSRTFRVGWEALYSSQLEKHNCHLEVHAYDPSTQEAKAGGL